MTISTISTLPAAPARTDAPATFITKADTFLSAIVTMQSQLNVSIGQFNADAAVVEANKNLAIAAVNATLWVSATSYSAGDVVYSPITFFNYRANTGTSGTTDPSLSGDWTVITNDITSTSTSTLSNKTFNSPIFTGTAVETVYNWASTTGAVTTELEPGNGTIQTLTLTGNITSLTNNMAAGETITIIIDDGTSYTITWPTGPTIVWVNNGGSAPTLSTTDKTVVTLWKVGSTTYGALIGDGT